MLFTCPVARGAAYHHGAHVIDWTPKGRKPVLWMSDRSLFDADSPIRGGIPICFPWFGVGRNGRMTPAHGFARLAEWRFLGQTVSDGGVAVRFFLMVDGSNEVFPFPAFLTYDVTFGAELHVALTVRNVGVQRFSYEAALHTYLNVGDIAEVTVSGLDGAAYTDRAAGALPGRQCQAGDLRIDGEVDRIYTTTADVIVQDASMKRSITVQRDNSANVVVWNPGPDKAKRMTDFGDDEYNTMLCVETANIAAEAIGLAPDQSHTMGFTLTVKRL